MRHLFTFSLLFFSLSLFAQKSVSITYSTEEEHALEWLEATRNWTGLPVGSRFPAERFTTLEGKEFSIPGAGKKLYVVHFWSLGCGAFEAEEDRLKKLREEFQDRKEVGFISFCASPKEKVQEYMEKNGSFGYEIVSTDSKENTEKLFKVVDTTTHMLLDENGKILENFTTSINFDEMLEVYKNKIKENI